MMGWQGDSDVGTLVRFRWCHKLVLPVGKHDGKHGNTPLPFGPGIPVFATSTEETNSTEAAGRTQSAVLQRLGN